MQIQQNYNNQQTFGAYLRFKDTPEKILKLREAITLSDSKYICANLKKNKKQYTLDVVSGKELNKLLDIMKDNFCFFEIRNNLPKYLGKKPQKAKVKNLMKECDVKA